MFSKSTEFYDLVYSFKDYVEESRMIRELVRGELPQAKSILDVACGTAEHAKHLVSEFTIDGIDFEPAFVDIASRKIPAGKFSVADMRDFALGKRFDVVMCLFSSIGYLASKADVVKALSCFREHLAADGIVIVEPWFTPSEWKVGALNMIPPVDLPELKIVRMNISERVGNFSKLKFHYLIGEPSGISYFQEDHTLALYTVEEMLECFAEAGLKVKHDPEGIFGRGLYIARAHVT